MVRNSTQLARMATATARKNSTPSRCRLSCRPAKGQRNSCFGPTRYTVASILLMITFIRPTPKVVRARPVTFWLARRVTVRKE